MDVAKNVLRNCLGGKKLNTDKWSTNKEEPSCHFCGVKGKKFNYIDGVPVCNKCVRENALEDEVRFGG